MDRRDLSSSRDLRFVALGAGDCCCSIEAVRGVLTATHCSSTSTQIDATQLQPIRFVPSAASSNQSEIDGALNTIQPSPKLVGASGAGVH